GGRVDATLGLRFRDALHAVGAGFEFEMRVGAAADHARDNLAETAVLAVAGGNDFHAPAAIFAVLAIHAKQVAGKQCRFVAAGAGANFQKQIGVIVWVLGKQMFAQYSFEFFEPIVGAFQFGIGHVTQFRLVGRGHV